MLKTTALILLLSTNLSLAETPLKYMDAYRECKEEAILNYATNSDEPVNIIVKAVFGKCRSKAINYYIETPRGRQNVEKIDQYIMDSEASDENIIISKILDARISLKQKGSF